MTQTNSKLHVLVYLAHLSRRLIWWAYRISRPPSSVVRHRPSSSTLFKHLLLRNHWANQSNFIWSFDGMRERKFAQMVLCHMIKMAAMPIYDKILKQSSSPEPKGWWPWILICIIGCSSTTEFAQMMTLGWPWPILRQGQIWPLMLLYGKKGKTMFCFRNYCRLWFEMSNCYRWLKWQEVAVDIKTLSPGGYMPIAPGLYACIRSWKNVYNQTSKRFLRNLQQMGKVIRSFCWHHNFVPWGLAAPVPEL